MTSPATESSQIHLEPKHLEIVLGVLQQHVPDKRVWVFGSRATGVRLKKYSDLDIAVSGQLSITKMGSLAEAFEESLLPMKVDVVALATVAPDFAARIEPDFISLQ